MTKEKGKKELKVDKITETASSFRIEQSFDTKQIDMMKEIYAQSCENERTYMNLRYKHFTTFVVVTSLIGGAAFKDDTLANMRPYVALSGIIFSILFWLLDHRTSQHQKGQRIKINSYEEMFPTPKVQQPKHRVLLRASNTTNLIFLLIILIWSLIAWASLTTLL